MWPAAADFVLLFAERRQDAGHDRTSSLGNRGRGAHDAGARSGAVLRGVHLWIADCRAPALLTLPVRKPPRFGRSAIRRLPLSRATVRFGGVHRSEERRVGKECRSWWS